MKILITSALVIFFSLTQSQAALATDNCDFYLKSQNLCASLQWLSVPAGMNAGSFRLTFWNKDQGASVRVAPNAAKVSIKLMMSAMGHGGGLIKVNPTFDQAGNPVLGQYDATDVSFMMPGKWEIILQLKDASSTVFDSAQINYIAN